jgi:carbamoyltransferase
MYSDYFNILMNNPIKGTELNPELKLDHIQKPIDKDTIILGVSCYYHDSSVCILREGKLLFAASEERFSRIKHDARFPEKALQNCFDYTGIGIHDVNLVIFYESPMLKLRRILSHNYTENAVLQKRTVNVLKNTMEFHSRLKNMGYTGPVQYSLHHHSHAASAFFPSPFEKALTFSIDGVGEYSTCGIFLGEGNKLKLLEIVDSYPHSIGLLYSAITAFLGFRPNNDEFKVMGLASYGSPIYREKFEHLIKPHSGTGLSLQMNNFIFDRSNLSLIDAEAIEDVLDIPKRHPESTLTQAHMDIAATLQKSTEDYLCSLFKTAMEKYGVFEIAFAGGVALNCVANAEILKRTPAKAMFIQPAAGDAGTCIGAAYLGHHIAFGYARKPKKNYNTFLGPDFSNRDIKTMLEDEFVYYEQLTREDLMKRIVSDLESGRVVGWFQGRMEFGPRALGNRSILANPYDPEMQDILNTKIKHRESFRPFAPAVIQEDAQKIFDFKVSSPYMLYTAQVKCATLPSITHIDGSARLQTVSTKENECFYELIKSFGKNTGAGVLVNTSFNVRGEPIVCTPNDAFRCFLNTDIDVLVLDNYVVDKTSMFGEMHE